MLLRVGFCICASFVATIRSMAVDSRPGSRTADPLIINQNITDLETMILTPSNVAIQSKRPHCDDRLGTPPLGSCMEAVGLIPRNNQQVTFGQRRSRGLVDHVMPYDLVSCKSITANVMPCFSGFTCCRRPNR